MTIGQESITTRVTMFNKIKNASMSGIFTSFLKCLGYVLFQFPSDNFKLSKFAVLCFTLKILFNIYELYVTTDIDAEYYSGKSTVLTVSSYISCSVYGILVFTLSFLSFIQRKKIFEIFKRAEIMETNVSLKLLLLMNQNLILHLKLSLQFKCFILANWMVKMCYLLIFNYESNLIIWIMRIISYLNSYAPLEMYQFLTCILYKKIEEVNDKLE